MAEQPDDGSVDGAAASTAGDTSRPRVVVIGAGIAGLAAARKLRRKASVVVVEARERLGGRICTERLSNGSAVDMGAAWVHGAAKQNPLVALAKECGARLVETDWDGRYVSFEARGPAGGHPEPQRNGMEDEELDRAEAIFKQSWQLFKREQGRRRRAWPAEADESLWEGLQKLRSKRFEGLPALDERMRNLVRQLWSEKTEMDYAAYMEDLSFTWWDIDDEIEGPQCLLTEGFLQIVEHVAQGVEVRLGAPVSAVKQHDDGGVEVVLRSGERLACEACVCTLPLGVLKAGSVTFDPPLPEPNSAAVERMAMGLLNKVALRFDRCPWLRSATEEGEEAHVLLRLPTSDARTCRTSLESPYMVSLREATGADVLVAYFVAGAAEDAEARSDEELVEHCLRLLSAMLPEEEMADLTVLDAKVSRWAADEFSLGSYSYLPPGATEEDRKALASPHGAVFFAGEATHMRFPSTVHGAFLSGQQVAKDVSAFFAQRGPVLV